MQASQSASGKTTNAESGREYTRINTNQNVNNQKTRSRLLLLMHRRWKILIVILAIAALAGAWRWMQEARYRGALTRYQHDLHPGMTRAAVDHYLESHQGKQGVARRGASGTSWSYEVRIGPDFDLCGRRRVYIDLNFNSSGQKELQPAPGDPSDVLKDIQIAKIEDCL